MKTIVRYIRKFTQPSLAGRNLGAGLLFIVLFICACSSDDDNTSGTSTFQTSGKPAWIVDLTGNYAAPSWTAPDPTKFESSMFIMVKLQDELASYSTDNDQMTVFIGDECRAVPAVRNVDSDENIYFVLKVRGNSTDRNVSFSLCYYCDSLRQLFTLKGQESFATERTYGVDEDFVPPLLKGCAKYPAQSFLTVSLPDDMPFAMTDGDLVAVFVGDECRGVGTVGKSFTVFHTAVSETVKLRYYSVQQGGIYTLNQPITLNQLNQKDITITF